MTVGELIEQLKDFDENMEVCLTYNYGDYWKTDVAPPVCEVDTAEVCYSEYHGMNKIPKEREDGTRYSDEQDVETVVVLR